MTMRLRLLNSQRGFSVVETIVAAAILGTVTLGISTLFADLMRTQKSTEIDYALQGLADQLKSIISSQSSWDVSKQNNSSMSCARTLPASCPMGWNSSISLYNSEGKLFIDANNPQQGFKADGSVCNYYGTGDCVFKASLNWKIKCSNSDNCKYPDEQIDLTFNYSGRDNLNISKYAIVSASRLNLAENNSPQVVCADKNQVFIGFGQKVADGDGTNTYADGDGCVSLTAFRGKTGDRGFTGPQGPMGPMGPAGGSGYIIYSPITTNTTPTNPIITKTVPSDCASTNGVDICALAAWATRNPDALLTHAQGVLANPGAFNAAEIAFANQILNTTDPIALAYAYKSLADVRGTPIDGFAQRNDQLVQLGAAMGFTQKQVEVWDASGKSVNFDASAKGIPSYQYQGWTGTGQNLYDGLFVAADTYGAADVGNYIRDKGTTAAETVAITLGVAANDYGITDSATLRSIATAADSGQSIGLSSSEIEAAIVKYGVDAVNNFVSSGGTAEQARALLGK
ncbi:MAG: hypothetical protein ACXVCY_11860 [Pseudobdellovibrionaceae bacterium]